MKSIEKMLRAGVGVLVLLAVTLDALCADKSESRPTFILFFVDRSGSMNEFDPPETTQAVVLHAIDLGRLSKTPIRIGVIFFGGAGVRVLGDDKGLPTAAHATLRNQLLREWPKAAGATPMDDAFREGARIIGELPTDSQIVIVLLTDGEPGSGRLRPGEFPEVAAAIDQQRKAIVEKFDGFPPTIVQAKLADWEQATLHDPNTAEFKKIYGQQVKAEFQATLKHAQSLQRRGVRFVTFDFMNFPALEEIHRAAGGRDSDLVRTSPNQVIEKLHNLRLLDLPRVVRLPTRRFEAEPQASNRRIEFPPERIAEAAVAVVEFHPAIVDFDQHCRMTATIGGETLEFSRDGTEPNAALATDAHSNVATASIAVEQALAAGAMTIDWESPAATMHPPQATAFYFLRLKEGVTTDFRPSFAKPDVRAPFTVSANKEADWSFALRLPDEAKPYPLKSVEAVLHDSRSGVQTRVALAADAKSPDVFVAAKSKLPPGKYDVELRVELPSGASFTLTLHDHIHSILRDEAISVEIPQASEDPTEQISGTLSHVDFKRVGKPRETRTIKVILRTRDVDYPLTVVPVITIADRTGNSPKEPLIKVHRSPVSLQPGRAVVLPLTITLPEFFEANIQDGLFEGRLELLNAETNQPIPLVRFQPIVGVPDDAPVERVTFELKRTQLALAMPHALRNWIWTLGDQRLDAMIRVSIDQSFEREVIVAVSHDSDESQAVTMVPSGGIKDPQGRLIPGLRLVPFAGDSPTKDIAPKGQSRWRFVFQADESFKGGEAVSGFNVTGPGLAPCHVRVRIVRRQPLLANTIRMVCFGTVGVMTLLSLCAAWRWFRVGRFCSGNELIVTPSRPLSPFLEVDSTGRGAARLAAKSKLSYRHAKQRQSRVVGAQQSLSLAPSDLDHRLPIEIQPVDEDDPPMFQMHECLLQPGSEPELHLTVTDGGRFDRQRDGAKQLIRRALLVASFAAAIAFTLKLPAMLRTAQWIFDVVVPA